MSFTNNIIRSIQLQHDHNKNRNLFCSADGGVLKLTPYTLQLLRQFPQEILKLETDGESSRIIRYLTLQAQQAFSATNQYLNLGMESTAQLHTVYHQLWQDTLTALRIHTTDFTALEKKHTGRLAAWLLQTNPFSSKLNSTDHTHVQSVVCAEYSAPMQLHVLQLDVSQLKTPVLDIGCGQHAHLVRYLRSEGIAAFGIDRLIDGSEKYLQVMDWLDCKLPPASWGTIISNLSFSNHFLHHHQRANSEHIAYAQKYMEILGALQPGGSYHYAPHLPMMEMHLSPASYKIRHYPVNSGFMTAVVTRL
jgi:hypothetical protein